MTIHGREQRIHVRAGGRLHFGMIRPYGPPCEGQRFFGSAGLMIAEPAIELSLTPSSTWSASGPHAKRVLEYAQRLAEKTGGQPSEIRVESAPRQHVGLGTGTQLAMAAAFGAASMNARQIDGATLMELAEHLGRGKRSMIGIHGARHGGFIKDAGGLGEPARPVQAFPWPEDWWVIVVTPGDRVGRHGESEEEAFRLLSQLAEPNARDGFACRLALEEMLVGFLKRDLNAFGRAAHQFNRLSGKHFAAIQGGPYADPLQEAIIEFLNSAGGQGACQSSWGPTTFAICEGEESARILATRVRSRFQLSETEVVVTQALNRGIEVRAFPDP